MRGDDALGVEVLRQFQKIDPENAQFLAIQGDLSRLLNIWERKNTILIDCVQSGSPAGTIFEITSLEQLTKHKDILGTTHGMSLSQTIELAQQLDKLPASLIFLGAEGKHFNSGQALSEEVQSAIPELLQRLQQLIS